MPDESHVLVLDAKVCALCGGKENERNETYNTWCTFDRYFHGKDQLLLSNLGEDRDYRWRRRSGEVAKTVGSVCLLLT